MLWEPFLGKGRSFQRSGRMRLHGTPVVQCSKNVEVFPSAVSQRSGAPGDVRSPADGRKQAEFTSAVSSAGVVQAPQPVQRVRSRREIELFLISAKSEIIPPAPPDSALRLRRSGGCCADIWGGLRKRRRGQRSDAGAGRLGSGVSGRKRSAGVRGCARLRLPTDVSALRQHR